MSKPDSMGDMSILQTLLIMAYNCGRNHEATKAFTIEEGRAQTVDTLLRWAENVDPGDLAKPMTAFHDVVVGRG